MTPPVPPTGLRPARLPRSERVLLLVDFINPLATAALKERLAAQGVAAIYANDNYGVWQSDFHSMVSTCLGLKGPAGDVARLLYPQAADLTILKPRHSAFYASPLELLLTEMQARELVICALATDICVQLTATDAFLRDYRAWVPEDCTAAETPEAKAASLAYIADVLRFDTAAGAPRPPKRKTARRTRS